MCLRACGVQTEVARSSEPEVILRIRAVAATLANRMESRQIMKTRVAVFYGGRSPEHDVSIYTGLNALESLDQQRFSAFPVYISPAGEWLVGEQLRNRNIYLPRGSAYEGLESVTLDVYPNAEG